MSDNNGKGEVGLGYTNKIANRVVDFLIQRAVIMEHQRDEAVRCVQAMLPMPMAEAEAEMAADCKRKGPSDA